MTRARLYGVLAIILSVNCGGSPTAPPPAACETNNTGSIVFTNLSKVNYDIVWDGVRIISNLTPGATSPSTTAAAGIPHPLQFRHSSTQAVACGASPILIRCQATTLTCAN